MNAKADQDALDRAKEKILKSGVDPLTLESMSRALSLSEDALEDADERQRPSLKAQHALVIAIAHFISGAHTASVEVATSITAAAISEHIKSCGLKTASGITSKYDFYVKLATVIAWPVCVGLAIVAAVAIVQPELVGAVADKAIK